MEISEQERQCLLNELQYAETNEQPWVAFSEAAGFSPQDTHFFSTADEAESFCVASNTTVYLGGDHFGPDDYRITPSANLLRLLEGQATDLKLPTAAIADQMQAAGVSMIPGHNPELAEALMRNGDYFPLQWNRTIRPA